MTLPPVRAIIQARMRSSRFPGKMLAPLRGKPVLRHVIERVSEAVPADLVVVATSVDPSDDPLAAYARQLGVAVHRGPLEDVVQRFQGCLREFPCARFVRVNGDSPFHDPRLIASIIDEAVRSDFDVVTNVFPRSFPQGRSVEVVATSTFARLRSESLSADEREHVTKVFYNHPERYRIRNIASHDPGLASKRLVVDTIEDLERLEAMAAAPLAAAGGP